MLCFLASKDPWRVVVRCVMWQEDFSVVESPTVVSAVSLEFLCSKGLEAGQEQTVMEAELFSRLRYMTVCVGTSWISFGSQVQTWLRLYIFLWMMYQKQTLGMNHPFTSATHELFWSLQKNLRTQVLIINKGNIALFSSQHTTTTLLFLVFIFLLLSPPTLTEHQQMVQTSV